MKIFRSLEELVGFQESTAIAIGIFDGIHLGHRKVIQQAINYAKENHILSGVLTFEITRDQCPAKKAGNGKIMSLTLFYELLEEMGVDFVVALPFQQVRSLEGKEFIDSVLIHSLHATFVSCGQDFHFGKNATATWEDLAIHGKQYGLHVDAVPLVSFGGEPVSSTRIRALIEAGDIPEANDLLGHRYGIDFAVVEGNRIGRTLGSPTINQPYPLGFIQPRFGVYATLSFVDNKWYTSVTNVGTKPTIGDYDVLAETYIQGFDGDLYGRQIRVDFLQFIRKETKFNSIEDLRACIQQDSEEAAVLGSLYLE